MKDTELLIASLIAMGKTVKEEERYSIYDMKLDDLTVSLTILNPSQSTRGHKHEDNAEVYYVLRGNGIIYTKEDLTDGKLLEEGDVFMLHGGTYHKVLNMKADKPFVFVAVFRGNRESTEAKYK